MHHRRRPGGRPGGQGDPVPGRCRQDGRRRVTGRGGAGGAEPGDRASRFPTAHKLITLQVLEFTPAGWHAGPGPALPPAGPSAPAQPD